LKGFKEVLGIEAEYGEITAGEEALAQQYFDEEIGTEELLREIDNPAADEQVLAGTHTGAGGTIDAFVKLEGPTQSVVQRVLISGDFFVTPPRIVFDLESALAGTRLDEVDAAVGQFFASTDVDTLSVTPADFIASIANALEQRAAHG
jgi:lipoate-protein ligase A